MIEMLLSLIPGGGLTVAVGAVIAVIGALWRAVVHGQRIERAKTAQQRLKARELADEVENDVGAMPPEDAREELKKWAR